MPGYAPDTTTGSTATTDWRHDSACAGQTPDLHFPVGNTGPALLQIEEAKAVCRRCPVMDQCLAWALGQRIEYGIFGGLDEDERRVMKRRARRKPAIRTQLDRLDDQAATARDLYERHAAGESINAIATATGMTWWAVSALVGEGRSAS
jgi:WhiB family redox-sensing transcriptional regulator